MPHPHTQAGKDLADGWCATIYGVIGDNDFKRDVLNMINISTGRCNYCPCDRKKVPWFDFSLWAKWDLIRKQIGLSSANVFPDWMHDKYLGTDKVQKKLS